jgi:hypothetical protein
MTCVLRPNVIGDLAINDKAVVDKQLLTGPDRSECMNESRSPVSMASQLGSHA